MRLSHQTRRRSSRTSPLAARRPTISMTGSTRSALRQYASRSRARWRSSHATEQRLTSIRSSASRSTIVRACSTLQMCARRFSCAGRRSLSSATLRCSWSSTTWRSATRSMRLRRSSIICTTTRMSPPSSPHASSSASPPRTHRHATFGLSPLRSRAARTSTPPTLVGTATSVRLWPRSCLIARRQARSSTPTRRTAACASP